MNKINQNILHTDSNVNHDNNPYKVDSFKNQLIGQNNDLSIHRHNNSIVIQNRKNTTATDESPMRNRSKTSTLNN